MKKIKVMVIEDSQTAQLILQHIITKDPELELYGLYKTAEEALESYMKQKPDVVLADIHLPGMSGYDFTYRIMRSNPAPVIIMTANTQGKEAEFSFKSMEVGALTVLEKPKGMQSESFQVSAEKFISHIKMASKVTISKAINPLIPSTSTLKAVGIGGSFGGPQALQEILSHLPKDFPIPIFVVQHISSGFSEELAKWLQKFTPLTVRLADHYYQPQAGEVIVAPDNYNMGIDKMGRIQLHREDAAKSLQPSVSHLFSSLAKTYGKLGVGVLLTGMGKDGAKELLEWKKTGATTLCQDEATSLIFGMPKEAIALGAACKILPLEKIAPTLIELAKQ